VITTETIEGFIDETISFHYDVFADVLYLRAQAHMETPTIGDLSGTGDIRLLDEVTQHCVGLTVVSWWKRFGRGARPDSITEMQRLIEPLAKTLDA
jgi:hypothetical protein